MTSKKKVLLTIANGSTFLEVSKTDFENIEMDVPVNRKEQQKIASTLFTYDQELGFLKDRLEQLSVQKKGLMQVLLTGRVRVKI